MSLLHITYTLDGLLTIAIPIVFAVIVIRKFDLYWSLFWIGAVVFAAAEIAMYFLNAYLVVPFINQIGDSGIISSGPALIFGALFMGLYAAVFLELLRYGMFHFWAKDARSWVDGLLVGIGNGGVAAIFLGALIIYNFINMAMAKNADLSTWFSPEQLTMAQAQVSSYWSTPWYTTLNDFIQQLFIFFVQVALALVVLQVFLRKQAFWLPLAMIAHTVFETSRILAQNLLSPLLMDVVLLGFGIAGIAVIFALRPSTSTNQAAPEPAEA